LHHFGQDRQLKYLQAIANWKAENFETDVLISTAPWKRRVRCHHVFGHLRFSLLSGDFVDQVFGYLSEHHNLVILHVFCGVLFVKVDARRAIRSEVEG